MESSAGGYQPSAFSYELQAKTKNISAKADRTGHAPIAAFEKSLEVRSHKIQPIAFVGDCLQATGIKKHLG